MALKDDIHQEIQRLIRNGVDPTILNDLRTLVDKLPDDVRVAHDDARERYSPGDEVKVVVEDDGSGTRHGDPLARTPEGLVVFLNMADDDPAIDRGEQVDAVLSSVNSRMARGVPALTFDEDDIEAQG